MTAESKGTLDDHKVGIYIDKSLSVSDSAIITANAGKDGGKIRDYGIWLNAEATYQQTGGTVLATAYSDVVRNSESAGTAGIDLGSEAIISGGTLIEKAATSGVRAAELIISGGTVTGISENYDDKKCKSLTERCGIIANQLTVTGGEVIGDGGPAYDMHTYGIRASYNANVTGGTIEGTGGDITPEGDVNSIYSYGVYFKNLTMSDGTITGTAGNIDASTGSHNSYGVYVGDGSVSGTAKLSGIGETVGTYMEAGAVTGGAKVSGTGATGIHARCLTLYAKWTPIEYRITYHLNNGNVNGTNPAKYTIESNLALISPTRSGYTFKGWYTDSNFKKKVTKISKGSTGDLQLYAKWTPN